MRFTETAIYICGLIACASGMTLLAGYGLTLQGLAGAGMALAGLGASSVVSGAER